MAEAALAGKSIVIIGGTSGIGLSGAVACQKSGARLVVVGRDEASAAEARGALGTQVPLLVADACDPRTAPAAIERAIKEFGRLDGLYHVAGGSARGAGDGPLHELTDDGWETALRLNLTSLMYSNRAAVRQFLAQRGGGTVLNVGSVLAQAPSSRYFATHGYSAAKGAIAVLTRAAAAYYAPQNIRFNCIEPGSVNTPMARRAATDPRIMKFIQTKQPLDGGRIAAPQDLDAAVLFFLSDASRFVTGQVLAIDGGWSVSEGQYDA